MKKIKFLSLMVILSLLLCVLYGIVAIIFQYETGGELSPTLTENWYKVFGIEIAGTTIIYIVKRVSKYLEIKDKIKLKKENGIEITKEDFGNVSDTTEEVCEEEELG